MYFIHSVIAVKIYNIFKIVVNPYLLFLRDFFDYRESYHLRKMARTMCALLADILLSRALVICGFLLGCSWFDEIVVAV